MTFQKQPKQKSSYPGLLAQFEERRKNNWVKGQMQIKAKQQFKPSFVNFSRKNPN
ncbi:MAG: hypothetical protein AAB580_04510 [Patescibacteria group bacterium]